MGSGQATGSERRYEVTAMVLQEDGHLAMLCLGAIALSLPPQCGTAPIPNWSWDRVDNEQRASGSTWGDYHLVGTYDGKSFTTIDVGPPKPTPEDPADEIEIPCPEPEGGWAASDPGRTSDDDLRSAIRLAEEEPDSSGAWIKHIEDPPDYEGPYGPNDIVLVGAFTGGLDRHRAQLAEVWGGPLCVARYERTQAELQRIQTELGDHGERDFGIQILSTNTDVVHNQVEIGVVIADEETKTAVDDRYGEGTVRLVPALNPVD